MIPAIGRVIAFIYFWGKIEIEMVILTMDFIQLPFHT
jgi:hypothetical protein